MDTSVGADGGEEQESVTTTAGGNPNEPPSPAPASLLSRHIADICAHCAWRVSESDLFLGSRSLRKAAATYYYAAGATVIDIADASRWRSQSTPRDIYLASLVDNNSGNPNEARGFDGYSGLRNNSNNSSGGGVDVDDVSIFDDMPDLE